MRPPCQATVEKTDPQNLYIIERNDYASLSSGGQSMLDTHTRVYTSSCTCGEAHIFCSQTDTGQHVIFH